MHQELAVLPKCKSFKLKLYVKKKVAKRGLLDFGIGEERNDSLFLQVKELLDGDSIN